MKCTITVLIILFLAGFCSCGRENSTDATSTTITATDTTETQTRWNMDASNALWRENGNIIIKKLKKELTDKGWNDLKVNTDNEGRYLFIYSIVGHTDERDGTPITVWASIHFSEFAPEGEISFSYISESGREYESNEILPANDQRLYDYMYGEKLSQVE